MSGYVESFNLIFQEKLQILYKECTNPPQPDYICRASTCVSYGHAHNCIYVDDPSFKVSSCFGVSGRPWDEILP